MNIKSESKPNNDYTREMALKIHQRSNPTELKDEYNFLTRKINALQHSLRIDVLDPERRFTITEQIENLQIEREVVWQLQEEFQKISTIDKEPLYQSLWSLNYHKQVHSFFQIKKQSIASFLIHGETDYGQRWLLNRLVKQHVPECMTGKIVPIDVGCKVRGRNVDALWRDLASRLGLQGKQYSLSEIAEGAYKWLQTQNVLIVFKGVNRMPQKALQELIDKFWFPLANQVREIQSYTNEFKLFMLLVDDDGCVGRWHCSFVNELDLAKPYTPIKSPRIDKFTKDELERWFEDQYEQLPVALTTDEPYATVQAIWADSYEGTPEYVFRAICRKCGCEWDDVEKCGNL